MRKSVTIEQLRGAIHTMQADNAFSKKQNELILQASRLSRLEKQSKEQSITAETEQVELTRLFYALESLAQAVGITNFLEFITVQEDPKET